MSKFENTPHINLLNDIGFGKTVLMPGDPLRAKYIAENYLENPVLVNQVRGIFAYTGTYKGVKVSTMASGMGVPSIGIYSYELFTKFNVQNIMRIGTAGSISKKCNIGDVVAAMGACTNSSYINQYGLRGTIAPICNYDMLNAAKLSADELDIKLQIGNIYCSDTFYDDTQPGLDWGKIGCLAIDMESAGLYTNAMRLGKRALTICTISDLCYPPYTATTAEERQNTFTNMMKIALEAAVKLDSLEDLETQV